MSADLRPRPPLLALDTIALFLDVDGTLVEIVSEPGGVHVPDDLCRLLERLKVATGGALALVSGRPLAQLDALFSPLRLNAAGLHGLERRNLRTETVRATPRPEVLDHARNRLGTFAAQYRDLLLEDKGLTLALHYRNVPQLYEKAEAVAREVAAESDGALMLLAGKMVLELKPPDADKGNAIAAFMGEPPFVGRTPVFVGDDVTDEAGFGVVNQQGGVSIRIGDDDRPTEARFGLPDVAAMQTWLAELLAPPDGRGRAVA